MKACPFKYIVVLLLLFISFPACAEAPKFEWKIQQGQILKYEILSKVETHMDVLEETRSHADEEYEQQVKDFFGENNFSDGSVNVAGATSSIVVLEGLSENRIRAKSIVNNIESNAKPSFIQDGHTQMVGLVESDIIFNQENMGEVTQQTGGNTQTSLNEFNVATLGVPLGVLYYMPKKLKNIGDTENLDITCIHLSGVKPTRHEKSGQIKLTGVKVDDENHEIATLNYSYNEYMQIKNDSYGLFDGEAEYTTHSCDVNVTGYFNLTSGSWVMLNGALIAGVDGFGAGGMKSKSLISILATDKVLPKEVSAAEFQKEFLKKHPEFLPSKNDISKPTVKPVELCNPENSENDSEDCIEDPMHRWKQLKEEKKQRELNPKTHNTEDPMTITEKDCRSCVDPDKGDIDQADPLSRWIYLKCVENCEGHSE